jgi:hypothetical protein
MSTQFRWMMRMRRWMRWGTAIVVAALLLQASPVTAQQWNRSAVQRALQATVLVLVPDDNGDLYDSGSGTVLDAERGIILTNYHVLGDIDTGELYNVDGLAYIAVNPTGQRGAPVIKYIARLVEGTPDLDLAVLRITGLANDESAELPKNLGLVSVDRGNSDDLLPGDPLAVIGFPGLGGSTVTFTDGVVSGFLDEDDDGVYEWIKTDTEVNPGNSGGLAIDQQGDFIGVPTAEYSRTDLAGKISLIRPGTLALDYYDRAILGQGTSPNVGGEAGFAGTLTRPGSTADVPSDDVFGPITFAAGVTDDDQPADTGNAFIEAGEVYAFFSVTGLREGMAWRTRWLLDGQQVLNEEQPWEEGDTPSTWVSLSHPDGLPTGEYTLELYAGSHLAQSGSFVVEEGNEQRRGGAEAVNITGVVHDADNARKRIAGATIVFLTPGVTIQEWVDADFDDAMVLASGESVRGGKFQLDNKLTAGALYSVIVVHDNYQALQIDDFEIPADAPDPYELNVPLEKG